VHMLTVLTVLLSLLSLTNSCSPIVSGDKVLRTAQSVQNGAHYLKSLKEYNATSCFAGCCDLKDCDTVMHTGTKLTKRGTNCFYFNCGSNCVFNSSSSRSIKVATFPLYTSPLPELDSLVEPSAAPNATLVIAKETTTNSTSTDEGYHMDADTVTDLLSSDQKESNTTQTEVKSETVEKAEEKTEEADKTEEKTEEKATEKSEEKATEKAEVKTEEKTESEEKTEEKAEETVEETPKESEKPSIASSPVITSNTTLNSTIAKESTKIDFIPENKPAITVPQPKIVTQPKLVTEPKKEEKEEKVEKEESSMVNEVPALLHPTVNKSGEKSGEKDTNVKIEVKIDSTTDDMTGGLVFWVALALGAGLVSFGMITVCRCYTKKRRLYSALADDYLINGMYSI